MKAAGFLLLGAGWLLVVAALALLASGGARTAFFLAGVSVELLGFGLAVRAHLSRSIKSRGEN
jgi:hypothetical protein